MADQPMPQPSQPQPAAAAAPSLTPAERWEHYQRVRAKGRELVNLMGEGISRAHVRVAARQLGMEQDGVLTTDYGPALAILADFMHHEVVVDGMTLVERYVQEHPQPPGSLEELVLQSMVRGLYTIIRLDERLEHNSWRVQDLFFEQSLILVDRGFGETGKPEMLLAGRLFPVQDYFITSGAMLPLEPVTVIRLTRSLAPLIGRIGPQTKEKMKRLSRQKHADMVAHIARQAIEAGALDAVDYDERPVDR
jgi:hypothetical protein